MTDYNIPFMMLGKLNPNNQEHTKIIDLLTKDPNAGRLLFYFMFNSNYADDYCLEIKESELTKVLNLSRQTLRTTLKNLTESGILVKIKGSFKGAVIKSNTYLLLICY